MDEYIILSGEEVQALVLSILDGVAFVDREDDLPDNWPLEMRDWCELLLARLHGEGGAPRLM